MRSNTPRGFPQFLGWYLVLASLIGFLMVFTAGCTGTRAAYQTADSADAYAAVVAEHYAAVLVEAANIAENPVTPDTTRQRLRDADNEVRPLVLALRPLAENYAAVQSADNEIALQQAMNDAVIALHNFILLVKAAR